jgi:hypothetical protein
MNVAMKAVTRLNGGVRDASTIRSFCFFLRSMAEDRLPNVHREKSFFLFLVKWPSANRVGSMAAEAVLPGPTAEELSSAQSAWGRQGLANVAAATTQTLASRIPQGKSRHLLPFFGWCHVGGTAAAAMAASTRDQRRQRRRR